MQKGTVSLFIIIVVLLFIGLIGIFIFGLTKSPVLTKSPAQDPPAKAAITSSVLSDYQNNYLSFEFQYSNIDFTVKEDSEEAYNKRGNGDYRKNFKGYVGYEPGKSLGVVVLLDKSNSFDTNPFTIWVFDNSDNLSIDEWYKNYWYYPFVWGDFTYTGKFVLAPRKEATISGITAKSGAIDYQPGKPKFIYAAKDSKMYLFRVIGESGDKILSTFKFTR
ncbi:hypothetical protein KKE78_02805 [Patescibacteria group bacterium]|nr:hypothetical protein [Patescibacteria group bacterium]